MKIFNLFVAFIFTLLIFSCEDSTPTYPLVSAQKLDSLAGTKWKLFSFLKSDGSEYFLEDSTKNEFTLNFNTNSAEGISGCNKYNFDYRIGIGPNNEKDSIFTSNGWTTEAYCKWTNEYFLAIQKAKRYIAYKNENQLTILTVDPIMSTLKFDKIE